MNMENTKKIRKQFHSLSSELIIKSGGWLLGLRAVILPIHAFGAPFSAVAGVSGCGILRLVMRLIWPVLFITALHELEAKGCRSACFEYGNGLFRVRIFRGEIEANTVVYEQTINVIDEPSRLEEAINHIRDLKNHVTEIAFQCYKREFVKGVKSGEWEKTGSSFEFGDNATQSMLTDGSGYYIDDPDNKLQYFVDMKS
jgi:hypothetical protein